MAAYAVCPHCGKSIRLETEYFESGSCPLCEGNISTELLRMKNCYVNTNEANLSFEAGKQFFDNTDFRGAADHFKKSLEYNPNHYLSFYYLGLCEIYENEKNPQYDRPLQLMRLLKYSLLKLESAQVGMEHKIPFVRSALNEVNIMLISEFKSACDGMTEQPTLPMFRRKLVMMGRYISSFFMLDKELLLLFDQTIAQAMLAIADLGVACCAKACLAQSISEFEVVFASDEEYEAAKKISTALVFFITSVDPKYNVEAHRPNFNEVVVFNRDALVHVEKFYEGLGKKNRAHYLSTTGEMLTQLTKHCYTAVQFTYRTLFQNVYVKKNDPLRVDMLVQGLALCFEILMPRIHIDSYKRVVVSCRSRHKQRDIVAILSVFLEELEVTGRRYATEGTAQFYERVHAMIKMYFDIVTKTYGKTINKLKSRNGREFYYYLDFLLNIVHASALALTSTLDARMGKKKIRAGILKVGKLAAEEFLLLNDYNIVELEKNPMTADLIRIWNLYDMDIASLS